MLLPQALRSWLAANHDALSASDRAIATDLASEIEGSEYAGLATDLSVEQQVMIIATSSVGDRERVGHVFRSALHWHASGGNDRAGITEPPIAGALPPPVSAPTEATSTRPATASAMKPAAAEAGAPPRPRASARPPRPTPARQRRQRPSARSQGAVIMWGMVAILGAVAGFVALAITTAGGGSTASAPVGPTTVPIAAPEPAPTQSPATVASNLVEPTPTAEPQPTATSNPVYQAAQLDLGPLGERIVLRPLDGSSAGWTLLVSPRSIVPRVESDVIIVELTVRPLSERLAVWAPLRNPRLILVDGDIGVPNLGGPIDACQATWPQFARELTVETSGTICFRISPAARASPATRLLFESDGHEPVAFPLE